MRVAVVAACPFPWPRGTPIRIHRIAEALAQRGHEIHVVTYHLGRDARPVPERLTLHRIAGPAWYRRTAAGPSLAKLAILDPLLVFELRRQLARHAFDVIHAHHYEGLLTALAARGTRGPPIVFDVHTLLERELPAYGGGLWARLARRWGRSLDRTLPPRADQVIAVSDEIRDRLLEFGRVTPAHLTVISNGVEIENFGNAADDGTSDDLLTFAGNLAPYQRIDLLLQAFAQVVRARPGARLEILTSDPFAGFAALRDSLGIADRVSLIDVEFAALPAHLRRATVLANPRVDCSGIPQKLLNYMASGRPIVSFAGSAKLLQHEHSGLVVRDADVDGFASAVLRLMADPALRAALAGRAHALIAGQHTWQRVAERVEQVYARAVAVP